MHVRTLSQFSGLGGLGATCPPGTSPNLLGQCVPSSFSFIPPPTTSDCGSGQVKDSQGQCVDIARSDCPAGTFRNVLGQCVPTSFSLEPTRTVDVATAAPCPAGMARNLLGGCVPTSFSLIDPLTPPAAPDRTAAKKSSAGTAIAIGAGLILAVAILG